MINILEITAALLGITQGVLVMLNNRANWLFYCLQMVALALFSFYSNLYGDLAINVLYFFGGLAAFHLWGKACLGNIKRSKVTEIVWYTVLTAIATLTFYAYLMRTSDPLPLLDSLTTSTSMLATVLMILRRIDCWIVWLINDILYTSEYYMLPNQAPYLMALNCIWCAMAVLSFVNWKKHLRTTIR